MASWSQFQAEAPSFAGVVRARFDVGINKTIATLRRSGAPRISGTELEFRDGEVTLGMMPGSLKLRDVLRDPRVAVHGPSPDPPDQGAWAGDAKVAGTLIATAAPADAAVPDAGYFRIDLTEVVLTSVDAAAALLVVESWHPGRGYRRRTRA